jgi:N-acetylornithine carbamoyltransferase
MGWAERYGEGPGRPDYAALEGKKFVLTWAQGALARSWCSVQEALLIASRFGMHISIARPDGYDLDQEVLEWTKRNCRGNGTTFEVTNDPVACMDGAHIVYARNWMSPDAYQDGEFEKQAEIERSLSVAGWTLDATKMARTDNAIFTHPMPVDRGNEVSDEVASGPRSAIYDIAENRLHTQKAVMALTMGNL